MSSENNTDGVENPDSVEDSEAKQSAADSNNSRCRANAAAEESDNSSSDGGHNGHAPKSHLRAWFHYFAYIAIGILSVLVDPFNWTETTATVSRDLLYRMLIGPFYSTDHRDQTTVVLFREKTLIDLGSAKPEEVIHWPVSLKWHAEILEKILLNDPAAVMVDFIFPDQRPDEEGVEALKKVNQSYQSKGVPLLFARAEGSDLPWIRQDLLKHLKFTSITRPDAPGIAHGISRTYEPCTRVKVKAPADPRFGQRVCACATEAYELEPCPLIPDGQPSTSEVAFSAAFQLYHIVTGQPPKPFDVDAPVGLQVVWSNRFNELNNTWMRQVIDGASVLLCKKIKTDPWNWLLAVLDTDRYRQTCPYTDTLPAETVLLNSFDPVNLKNLRKRVVFYGGDLAGLADTVIPPTHAKLPGVYLHAMAFDNLLAFDGDYRRALGDVIGSGWEWAFNLLLAAIMATVIVRFARTREASARESCEGASANAGQGVQKRRRWVRGWWSFGVLAALAILGLCAVVYATSRLEPLDWLGFSALFAFLSALAERRFVEGAAIFVKQRALPWLSRQVFKEERT